MASRSKLASRVAVAAIAATTLGLSGLVLTNPAAAAPDGSAVVINEVYGGGGNFGAPFANDFIELYNPTNAPVSLSGYSVQYFSAAGGSGGTTSLSGSIPAKGHYLIAQAKGAGTAAPLPTPDASGTLNMSGTAGSVVLSTSGRVIDTVGYGSAAKFEGAPTAALSSTTSAARANGVDTDNNAADFTAGAPTPTASAGGGGGDGGSATTTTIDKIQGTGDTSPMVGQKVITTGVVTATYPTGGFNGFYLQTGGTGGAIDPATHNASDAIFVYAPKDAAKVQPGQSVQVEGTVTEYNGLTEINASAVTQAPQAAPVQPAEVAYPRTDVERERLEGMLVAPQGPFTVADTYSLNQYGEVGLAAGTKPLVTPTEVVNPKDAAAIKVVEADNAARAVSLDDASTLNFFTTGKDVPLSYLTQDPQVRVGAAVTFREPVILDYRFGGWSFQPTYPVDGTTKVPASFSQTRPAAPAVGGNVRIASFNVLNYFPTTGADFEATGGKCTYYKDRAGNNITVNTCTGAHGEQGPRGAADQANFARQQTKIVAAINTMNADVVSLEEIENSAKFGHDRDRAVSMLVGALNAKAGKGTWSFVPTPPDAGDQSKEDVIRTAFIYRANTVQPMGDSVIDDAPAFDNARDPLGQLFKLRRTSAQSKFAVIVNHFKSKGSGVNDGTGQGNANPDRIAQAKEVVRFSDRLQSQFGTKNMFLVGDFNSYTQEDPMQELYGAGYTDIGSTRAQGQYTYLFGGMVGSLDHALATPAALKNVTGAEIWNINKSESVANEYSRFNYNVTDFYRPDQFRASDHDPLVVGLQLNGNGPGPKK